MKQLEVRDSDSTSLYAFKFYLSFIVYIQFYFVLVLGIFCYYFLKNALDRVGAH